MKQVVRLLCVLCVLCGDGVEAAVLPIMQTSFTGGEISPQASARLDAARYYTSAATMVNLIAIPQGPAVRRPGTKFVAATDGNHTARLLAFRYSRDDVHCLEFTDSVMRVYADHGIVSNDDGSIYELTTPFDANSLDDLQVWQTGQTCYLVDGARWPQELVRTDANDWSICDANIDDGPFLDENVTATTITAAATTGTDVNLVSSTAIFQAGHVGSYWRIRDVVAIQTAEGTLSAADTNSVELTCQADQQFQWYVKDSSFIGRLELQMSIDSGATWQAYTVLDINDTVDTGNDTVYDNDTDLDILLRVRCTEHTSGSLNYTLWCHAYMHTGVVEITEYVDPCNVACDVVRDLAATSATTRWSEGAWSDVRGYPRAIASYNDRLVLASTTYQPLTIWWSATGEYEVFDTGAGDDDDSFGWDLARSEQDPILWLTSQRARGLVAGTTGNVFEILPFDVTQGITPSNPPTVVNTLAMPCAAVPPVLADNILLVLQRGGRKLHEVLFSEEADSLVAPDVTLFARHVTQTAGISEMAWTSEPYPLLWAAKTDGTLAAMTYDRNYQVLSWSRHELGGGGLVESLCSVPGAIEDELWLCVRRTIGGSTVRYVEYLAPWDWGTDQNDVYFVDCGLTYDSTAATTFTGAGHLEGQAVQICADGDGTLTETIASGSFSLDNAASVVHVGLAYTSTLTTIRYDLAAQPGEVTWHRQKTVPRAVVSFYETLGAKVGPNATDLIEPTWQASSAGMLVAGVPALFSGDQDLSLRTSFATDAAKLTVVQERPLPMTVRAIVACVEVR